MSRVLMLIVVTLGLVAGCGGERTNFYVEDPNKKARDPFLQVHKGMTEAEIVAVLGEPAKRQETMNPKTQEKFIILDWEKPKVQAIVRGGVVRDLQKKQ